MGCFSIRAVLTRPEPTLPSPNTGIAHPRRCCNFNLKDRITLRALLFSLMLVHASAGFFFGHKLNDPDARHTIGSASYGIIRDCLFEAWAVLFMLLVGRSLWLNRRQWKLYLLYHCAVIGMVLYAASTQFEHNTALEIWGPLALTSGIALRIGLAVLWNANPATRRFIISIFYKFFGIDPPPAELDNANVSENWPDGGATPLSNVSRSASTNTSTRHDNNLQADGILSPLARY